jgi:hypothetical protein
MEETLYTIDALIPIFLTNPDTHDLYSFRGERKERVASGGFILTSPLII